MATPLNKNPVGNNIEVLYTGTVSMSAVTAPSAGSRTSAEETVTTTITSGSGFVVLASIQFEGSEYIYPLPYYETMTSGGNGGEISWSSALYASLYASVGYVQVHFQVLNFVSTLYLPASTITFYILRIAASPAE